LLIGLLLLLIGLQLMQQWITGQHGSSSSSKVHSQQCCGLGKAQQEGLSWAGSTAAAQPMLLLLLLLGQGLLAAHQQACSQSSMQQQQQQMAMATAVVTVPAGCCISCRSQGCHTCQSSSCIMMCLESHSSTAAAAAAGLQPGSLSRASAAATACWMSLRCCRVTLEQQQQQ
jgi:hypothetical protein